MEATKKDEFFDEIHGKFHAVAAAGKSEVFTNLLGYGHLTFDRQTISHALLLLIERKRPPFRLKPIIPICLVGYNRRLVRIVCRVFLRF